VEEARSEEAGLVSAETTIHQEETSVLKVEDEAGSKKPPVPNVIHVG
jgi:hypothetical protein